MKTVSLVSVLGLALVGAGASACKKSESKQTESTSPAPPNPKPAPTPVEGHGDHDAQHGGAVLMDERGHMELVFKADGAVEIWLSDNMRKPLPASSASSVELSVTRPGQAEEKVALARDSADSAWTGKTAPITDPATRIHFAYNAAGKQAPYQIDISLADLRKMQEAVEPAHQHGDDHGDRARDTHQGDGHSEHQHGAVHGDEGHIPAPATLKEAVAQMDAAYNELAAIVRDGDLSKAHATAERLGDVGDALPKLAADAKLPADTVKALTVAGKKLRLFFKDMDKAGDAGDRKAAQRAFVRYQEPVAAIKEKAGG